MKRLLLSLLAAAPLHAAMPALIAHRGASEAAPENTLAAFRSAWDEGADGIEGDFHLTADGEVVCIHDADTGRVADRKLVIAASTFAQLSGLDVGSWKSPRFAGEKIPRLADVLDTLKPGRKFFIEIKSGPAIVEPIARILAEKKADPARVVLISFDASVITACREKLPVYQAHWISALKNVDQPDQAAAYFKQFTDCRAQGLQFDCRAPVSAKWLESLRAPLTSWTVNDVRTARKVIALGVSHITTNRPGALRRELETPEESR